MKRFVEGEDRRQGVLLPEFLDDYVSEENPVAYTKGDLIDYYRNVAPWFLPYLADRPITLTRYPDGIHGKSFFQKDAPPFIPGWMPSG